MTKKILVPINVKGDVVAEYGNFTFGAIMGGFPIDGVADPTTAQQAATKQYVDVNAGSEVSRRNRRPDRFCPWDGALVRHRRTSGPDQ